MPGQVSLSHVCYLKWDPKRGHFVQATISNIILGRESDVHISCLFFFFFASSKWLFVFVVKALCAHHRIFIK